MTSAPTTNIPVAIPAGATRGASGPLPPRTIAGSLPAARTVANRLLHGTPGRMRLLGLLGVIAAVALGAISANALLASQAAVERAANNTAQVVRAQSMHVDLLRADAVATNAFLRGGVEPTTSRQAYDDAMARVATGIAEAAAAQPADGKALGALSQQVQTYAALVEQARANNRLGLPVGAQYLTQASAGLRSNAIPIVEEIVKANEGRARDEFSRSNSSLQLLVGVVALIGLGAIAVWLARRTHRYVNPSLTGAVVVLIVALFVTASVVGSLAGATRDVANGDYQTAVKLAGVTTAANDARANESLTLIRRGSGGDFEKSWQKDGGAVTQGIEELEDRNVADASRLDQLWKAYSDTHERVRTLDDGGKWDDAVKLSTSTAADGAAGAFGEFDAAASQARDEASTSAVDTLRGLGGSAGFYALGVAVVALLASWLIVRGIGQRIEDYR